MGENLWSNFLIIIYILSWTIYYVRYQRKRKIFDAGSFVLSSYIIFAIFSLILYNGTEYAHLFKEIHAFPFIYLFFMLLMATSTILKYDITKIDKIQSPSKIVFILVSLFFIISSLSTFPSFFSNLRDNLIKMVLDSEAGQKLYEEAISSSYDSGSGGISNLAAIFSSAFYNIGVLFTFYYFTLPRREKWLSVTLVLSCLTGVLASISLGQRGGTVIRALTIFATYFLFKNSYSEKIRKNLKIGGTCFVLAISIPILLLSLSRFSEKSGGTLDSVIYYAGQENLYFNNYALDNGGIRYGDRTALLFKKMLGFKNVPNNYWKRREKYHNLKIDDDVFYTFVGDFAIDYGPIVSVFLFIIFTLLFRNLTRVKKRCLLFHQLILVHFVLCVCIQGGMTAFSFSDIAGNLQIIVVVLAYVLFKFDYWQKSRKIWSL